MVQKKLVMVQSTSNYNERRILFKKDDIDIGDIIVHEGRNWLVTEIPFFNKIHSKSKMLMCTQVLSIHTEAEERILGYDNLGRPITKIVEGKPLEFPCVVQSVDTYLNEGDTDGNINFPDGRIVLFIQNTRNANVTVGKEFTMFGFTYRIFGINRSKVIDNKGILIINADKIQ